MSELEAEALKLPPRSRLRLAQKLVASLEELSEAENEQVWADEAELRTTGIDPHPGGAPALDEALREARAKLR